MKVLKKIRNAYVAQFDCHLRPFVFQIELDNEADPKIILLLFEEANEAGVVLGDPIRVTLKLEAHTWQEIKPDHKQSWQGRTLSQEFFQDKSKTVIRLILERIKAARYDEDTCLSAFKMSQQDVQEGILVSYTEVMTYGEDDKDHPPIWFGYDLTIGAQRYLIDDRYCSNPRCDCGAVYLEFIKVSSPRSEAICLLLVGFDGKRMEVQECRPFPKAQARILLNQLLAQESELLTECQRRYKCIRQVTKRIYEKQQRLPNEIIAPRSASTTRIVSLPTSLPSVKISRNSPCPCGSGKKYKQCCAGRSPYNL